MNSESADWQPRELCQRCKRPLTVCYCANLPELATATKVVVLQHPREHGNAIGTAWMAKLCLPNSQLFVGINFEHNRAVRELVANDKAPAVLLYPGNNSDDILSAPPTGATTLVVIDGTWAQAKVLVRENPFLASLPRYAFVAPRPSEYRIRKEPSDQVVSTIESLMYALGAIENDTDKFTALLTPFRTMINHQLRFNAGKRARKKKRVPKPRPPSPELLLLRERSADLVCVVGEVNAWPYELGRFSDRDELVHWVAIRVATGERFELLRAPRHGWSPSAQRTLRFDAERLTQAQPCDDLPARFNAFVRDSDILCAWGWFSLRVFGQAGDKVPVQVVDVRKLVEEVLRTRVPRLEALPADKVQPLNGLPPGRANERLAMLTGAVELCLTADLASQPAAPRRTINRPGSASTKPIAR